MGTPYLAEIRIVSFNFPPKGWAFCNGQLLPINQNQALFSILGTTYGGNGQTTFALPNFQGRVPVHSGDGINLGESSGETAHTLTVLEMPSHTHAPQANSGPANSGTPVNSTWGANSSQPYAATADVTLKTGALNSIGGGQPHQNLQPYLVLNFIIALQGIFPSQN